MASGPLLQPVSPGDLMEGFLKGFPQFNHYDNISDTYALNSFPHSFCSLYSPATFAKPPQDLPQFHN